MLNMESDESHCSAQLDNYSYFNSILSSGNLDIKVSILCDTGARPNLLSYKAFCMLGRNRPKLDSVNIKLESAPGDGLLVLGSATQ